LTFNRVDDLPPPLRPFGVAGEVLGSGASVVGATHALSASGARLAPSLIGNLFNRILDTAQRAPVAFTTVEASSLVGSATGGGLAESVAPGNIPARIGGELAGGFLNIPRAVTGISRYATNKITEVASLFSSSAAETNAARILRKAVVDAGGDPAQLVKLLKEADLPGIQTTAGQKTGDTGLAALEKDLIEQSREFGNAAHQSATDTFDALGKMVTALKGTGDPQAFRAAAELRQERFRMLLQHNVDSAHDKAIQEAGKLSTDTPEDLARLSTVARDILDTSLKKARTAESELWEVVDKTMGASPTKLLARHSQIRGGMLPRQKLPAVRRGSRG
jgi:hypothetical protein